ncbi:MAG: HAD-IIIA family hydrolase [Verrucomicrobiota bacterium]|nr:HAD-IIIA family hydrolase [Verrucomicrobiota bacterium]
MRSAIFFERDGVLNLAAVSHGQQTAPRTLEEFKVNPEALAPLTELKKAGFVLIATTNQPGISRGYISRRELDLMHLVLKRQLPLDDLLMCPHDEMDRCPCRKPNVGLFQEAAFKYNLDLDHSFVVSDKWQDAQAAHNLGSVSLMLRSPWNGRGHYDYVLPDLASIVPRILQLHANPLVLRESENVKE